MPQETTAVRSSFWTLSIFYLLIAFEFFYMASPFAVYFYSVYGPSLTFLNNSNTFAWLSSTFLPHVVLETKSPLLNLHNYLGSFFFASGLVAFFIGAAQIYYAKLTRKKEVTGGIYKIIRHPQYAALIVSGFGLLILWPRFLALIMYTFMLVAYYFLAKVEEKECTQKFGESYLQYKEQTHMFFPVKLPKFLKWHPKYKMAQFVLIPIIFVHLLFYGIALANLVYNYSLNNLYAVYEDNNAYISVTKIDTPTLQKITNLLHNNPQTQAILYKDPAQKHLNYILPQAWHIPEIPMKPVNGETCHLNPANYDHSLYRVIITQAVMRDSHPISGKQIITHLKSRIPVAEVEINLNTGQLLISSVAKSETMYQNIPVPIY